MIGCNSYKITQTSHFADDDGAILCVDYGRSERDHASTFVSPVNGREVEFKSKLVVEVTMPGGESFTAWQCMNRLGNGTLYQTGDGEWYFLASGFTCKVARRNGTNPSVYDEVYRGVLCNTPVKIPEKDSRWHRVRVRDKKYTAE